MPPSLSSSGLPFTRIAPLCTSTRSPGTAMTRRMLSGPLSGDGEQHDVAALRACRRRGRRAAGRPLRMPGRHVVRRRAREVDREQRQAHGYESHYQQDHAAGAHGSPDLIRSRRRTRGRRRRRRRARGRRRCRPRARRRRRHARARARRRRRRARTPASARSARTTSASASSPTASRLSPRGPAPARRPRSRRRRARPRRASASECVETPTSARRRRARAPLAIGSPRAGRCTPSAPAASATSARSLTTSGAAPRAIAAAQRRGRREQRAPLEPLGAQLHRRERPPAAPRAPRARAPTVAPSKPSVIRSRLKADGYSMSPCSGDDAAACSFLPMRPARNALRPASTPSRIASAISTGFLAPGDAGVHEHRVAAELERHRRVRGRAHAGVDDDRHLHRLEDDAQVVRVANAEARCRSAPPAASPPRSRRPRASWPSPDRRWCTAGRRSRP